MMMAVLMMVQNDMSHVNDYNEDDEVAGGIKLVVASSS